MDSLIVATAQYLPLGIPLAAGVVWLFLPRRDKFGLAVKTIASLVFVVVLIKLGAAIYTDPRPFVVDPSVKPLFAHAADNGFPSDHTTVAATVALLVMTYRRRLGAVLLGLSMVAGAARVAAHVHHVQDIIAGLLIAAVVVGVVASTWAWAEPRLRARNVHPASR
jgi:membrane-associated phospholipid phosphatase